MKRKITGFALAFIVLAILAVITGEIRNMIVENADATAEDAEEISQDTDSYSYSEVENMVSYLAGSDETKKELDRLIDPLAKSQTINVQYIRNVFEIIDAPSELYAQVLAGLQDQDTVSRAQFDMVYQNVVEAGLVSGLYRQDVYIYDAYTDETGEKQMISDGEDEYTLDIELADTYMDCILDVYVKDGNVFKINGYGASSVTLRNVWLSAFDEDGCTFLYRGLEKTYPVSDTVLYSDSGAEAGVQSGCIASVTINNTGVCDVNIPETVNDVTVERITDEGMRLKDGSLVACSDDFCIYNVYDVPFCEESMQLLTGYSTISLAMEGNKAVGAVIDGELVCDDIRVILSNDDFTSYDMKLAEISGDVQYKVTYPDETELVYEAGESVVISADEYQSGDVFTLEPEEKNGHFRINTLSRSYGAPVYAGKIEVRICDGEVLHIINELPLEEYLYSVVASEMPSSSHEEALKALAICARGYAYSRLEDESFADYHADLDDSSLCQVYNNVEETAASIKAVKDTYGIVPTYDGRVIVPLYFSTSGGMTCTNEEIWGGSAYPYLESNVETIEKNRLDLSGEEDFRQFMDDSMGYDVIDKDMPYYRWRVEYTADEISQAVNSMLEERISMSADNIKVKNEQGVFVSQEIDDIGQILSIQITERTKSGVVAAMEIEGTGATIQVTGQTNIRNLITPVNQEIIRQDGSSVTGWTSLPSPFYYIESSDGGYVIYGGGFGHGSGMSQNGANILAEEGYNYKYILRHYYSYIDLTSIYEVEDEADAEE